VNLERKKKKKENKSKNKKQKKKKKKKKKKSKMRIDFILENNENNKRNIVHNYDLYYNYTTSAFFLSMKSPEKYQ